MRKIRLTVLAAVFSTILTTAAASAAAEIRIGVLTDHEEPAAGQGSVAAAEVAVQEMGGSVLGKRVRIIVRDHQGDPDVAVAAARELVDEHGVHMVTDLVRSNIAIAVQRHLADTAVVVMPTGAGASALHREFCAPLAFHWGFDTHALAAATTDAVIRRGGDSWFFVTADYAFGRSLEVQGTALAEAAGARVQGAARYAFGARDLTPQLVAAADSGASVIVLASGGQDTLQAIRQAYELGLGEGEQRLATMLMFLQDVRRLGLYTTAGLQLPTPYYWDYDDASRELAERIFARSGVMPSMIHAGTYSAVLNYLKAVEEAGTVDAAAVAAALRRMPIEDGFARNGQVRGDGLLVHDLFLVEVKRASESARTWDYYRVIEHIPGNEAYAPRVAGECPLP